MLAPDRRIFFNLDDTHFFYTRSAEEHMTEETIRAFIRQYEGTQISDFALCCTGRIADFPNKVRMWWGDKYDQTIENGIAVDYKDHPVVRCAVRASRESGLDFFAICIDELRKVGIRPHLSFRMNDCHENDRPASFLHPDYYHEHPEVRRVVHHAPEGYFDRCYDYAQPEVRQQMLDFIAEALDRYDADGIEIDWQREVFCFRVGREWEGLAILNEFMRQIRAIVRRAEEKRGHRILIAARTLPTPQFALDFGFDPITWAREGSIDILIPCPRWATTDSDIPTELWKQLLYGTPVLLAVGIEVLQRATPRSKYLYTTVENVHALSAQYLTMGADMLYLYNYFDRMDLPTNNTMHETGIGAAVHPSNYMKLLHTIGSAETAVRSERRHMMTYHDITPMWTSVAKGAPLPVTIRRGSACLRLRVGEIPEGAAIEVRLGASTAEENPFTLWANSVPCTYLRSETVTPAYTEHPAHVYKIENDGHMPPFIVLEIKSNVGEVTMDYAEIHVIP